MIYFNLFNEYRSKTKSFASSVNLFLRYSTVKVKYILYKQIFRIDHV